MSAYEGSELQLQHEEEKRRRERDIARVQAENPWLSLADCIAWVKQKEEESRPPPKCCPCQGRGPGVVRHLNSSLAGYTLGPCACDCHRRRPRLWRTLT